MIHEAKDNLSQEEIDYLRFNSYISDDYNIMYVSTPKVGCTSIKWWFAELVGVAGAIRHSAKSVETDPDLVIHDCFAKIAPKVTHKEADTFRSIVDSRRYFTFALVRNPFSRIFSAWQSKLLLREPYQSSGYLDKDFFKLPVGSKKEISIAFEAFLKYLDKHEAPTFKDNHWTPQFKLLCPDKMQYSYIGKIEEVGSLDKVLKDHIGKGYISPFGRKRVNESLLPFSDQFITPIACELIVKLYKRDFIEFGYSEELPSGVDVGESSLSTALHAVRMIRVRHQRFAEVQLQLSDLQTNLSAAEEELASRDRELNAYRSQADEFSRQVSSLQSNLLTSKEELASRDRELHACRSQADEFARQVSSLQEGLSVSECEIVRLASCLDEAQAQRNIELSSWKFLMKQIASLFLKPWRRTNKTIQ